MSNRISHRTLTARAVHTHMPLISLLLALLLLPPALHAADAPGELIVRLKRPLQAGSLDQSPRLGNPGVDTLLTARRASLATPFAAVAVRFPEMAPVVVLRVEPDLNLDSLQLALTADPNVEWVAPNHLFQTNELDGFRPNDSLYNEEWWLERISAPLAWDITRGDSTIIIGIIDTGVDYLHPDLRANLWVNWADADSDGVDDDHNGFIDDVFGWDFVDAPTLPSAGDHLVRDNDPMDELGHGTYVAGLAAATTDNGRCVASVGFNCRIMCLRAGNREGYLEEDDVAAALLYGAQMGARVLNMSFGDVAASPLLRETIRLVYQQGVVMVGSAGNNYSERIHYPSGFPEVIAVGATDQYDRRAEFSNYGPSVEIMAPGYEMRSTIIGGACGAWDFPHGTSYAAPIISAVAGLILSVNPELHPEDVKQILRSTADDIRAAGWDPETVSGRVNARRAVEQALYGADVVARITSPRTDQGFRGDFVVSGDAWGAAFDHYTLSFGLGENPARWSFVTSGEARVNSDSLGVIRLLDLPAQDTVLIVRLETHGTEGQVAIDHAHLFIQHSAPQIDTLTVRRMLDSDTYGDLVEVVSNQVTSASLLLTNSAGDSLREEFGYVETRHAAFLSQRVHPGVWQVRVRLENAAGLDTISAPFTFAVSEPPFTSNLWERTETSLTHGYLGPFTTDYNDNGQPEVWRLPIDDDGTLGNLQVFEWNGVDFMPLPLNYGVHIPQAVGDADGDGLREMMARRSFITRIWEQSEVHGPFNNVVFEDTSNCIGAGFVVLDSSINRSAIMARVYTGHNEFDQPRFILYDVGAGYALTPVDTLPNLTTGSNDMGPPVVLKGDLDRDGRLDFLYGDYDGDVIFCERQDGKIHQKWSARLPLNDATAWLAKGDIDGDGADEFIAGCRSNRGGGSESQRRSRHWEYYIFENAADDSFVVADSILILGAEDVGTHPASVTIADVDGDGRAEILISAFPDFYILTRDDVSGHYLPRWYQTPSASNNVLVTDWNGNGINEFFVSSGQRFARVEAAAAFGHRPSPPLNLAGEPLGTTSLHLNWNPVAGADHYRIHRAVEVPAFSPLAVTADTTITLTGVAQDSAFVYAVTAIDPAYPDSESVYSNYVTLTASAPPSVEDTARFVPPHFVELRFSEPMGESAQQPWSYALEDGRMPAVVSAGEGGRVLFLSFDGGFLPGLHTLTLRDLRDAQGLRLPGAEATVYFRVPIGVVAAPYILSHEIVGGPASATVEIRFSEAMTPSATDAANYQLDAPRRVLAVRAVDVDRSRVELSLDPHYPVGALGLPARLRLRHLFSLNNVPLDTASGRADLILGGAAASIADAYVFPNPYKGAGPAGEEGVLFAGLPEQATIRVFTLQGLLVRKIEHRNASGASRWNLINENGEPVSGGVYLYTIDSGGETVRGKLAVLR